MNKFKVMSGRSISVSPNDPIKEPGHTPAPVREPSGPIKPIKEPVPGTPPKAPEEVPANPGQPDRTEPMHPTDSKPPRPQA